MIKWLISSTVKIGLKCLPLINRIDCILHHYLSKDYNTELCKKLYEEDKVSPEIISIDVYELNHDTNNNFLIYRWKFLSLLIIILYIFFYIMSISLISFKKNFSKEIKSELFHIVDNNYEKKEENEEEETKFIEERTFSNFNKLLPLRTKTISPIRSGVSIDDLNTFINELRSNGFKLQQVVNGNEVKSKIMKLDKNDELYFSWRKSLKIPCSKLVSAIEGDGIPPSFILEVEDMNPLYFRVDSMNKATQMVNAFKALIKTLKYDSNYLTTIKKTSSNIFLRKLQKNQPFDNCNVGESKNHEHDE